MEGQPSILSSSLTHTVACQAINGYSPVACRLENLGTNDGGGGGGGGTAFLLAIKVD